MTKAQRLTLGIAAALGVAGAAIAGTGLADAGPQIRCVGAKCTNKGDAAGIGHGTYTCPNGLQYPSIAYVPAHGTAWVFPAQCGGPNLYGPGGMPGPGMH
ncbi:hypothetical protein [Gordonia sp. (in: high G+C Gram-positive bacteria)]|uniref:hypothetical protein n=1 Tax=Gordonia sp. (in: high G+C Gram-positive bacteria) TaxID=84139 RepID=UPI0039E40D01